MRRVLFAGTAAVLLFADDLNPPPWRGAAGSTFQHWQFGAPEIPFAGIPPDAEKNPYGRPWGHVAGGRNSQWLETYQGRNGVWRITGPARLRLTIPNENDDRKHKDLWLQITYHASFGEPVIAIRPQDGWFLVFREERQLQGEAWTHLTQRWHLRDCPNFEFVEVRPNAESKESYVDQIVIDTRCRVPG